MAMAKANKAAKVANMAISDHGMKPTRSRSRRRERLRSASADTPISTLAATPIIVIIACTLRLLRPI